ncbi:hypothetical protein BDW22DRAFT_1387859 [Trametopsis cervina]|nr:hypothetical protein BDW22DRAFT_1387859 [Trametopsis cervina]
MTNVASSSTATWQRLWNEAQPRLGYIRESLSSRAPPPPRITRVGKLDAELLDQELVNVLQEPVSKALSLVNSAFKTRFEPELVLLIQLTLYKFSLWDTGASYGAKLQGLKYVWAKKSSGQLSSLPRKLLIVHGTITLLIPYIHTRIRAHALSRAWPDAPSSDKRRKAWELLTRLESTHSLLALLNFVAFLWNGSYRTLTDRVLKMRLVSTQRLTARDVSYEFMNRQMVWHAFTEFLLFLLPLINTRAIRRRLGRVASQLSPSSLLPAPVRSALGLALSGDSKTSHTRKGKYWTLPLDQCAICYEDAAVNLNLADSANALTSLANPTYSAASSSLAPPEATTGADDEPPQHPLHTPYMTNCGHAYCYVCIAGRMIRTADDASGSGPGGTRWECLRCGEEVADVERVEAEVREVESDYSGSDQMSFDYGSEDVDYTDMSGSIGDYSEAGESE